MKVYLAGGYSIMNIKGREKELSTRFRAYRRLVSFFDFNSKNDMMSVINLNK